MSGAPVQITIPCYNEERRLDRRRIAAFLDHPEIGLVLVDDGSRDRTKEILQAIAELDPRRVSVVSLSRNSGKGEAVRQGLLHALAGGADTVGYVDADLSTPPPQTVRLLQRLRESGATVVLGSRIRMLGTRIQRRAVRHYTGRVLATAASLVLDLPVYDTQCGAKLFRNVPALRQALATPFQSRWVFDIELIARLMEPQGGNELAERDFLEVPLDEWTDVGRSKLHLPAMLRAVWDLARIGASMRLAARRASSRP